MNSRRRTGRLRESWNNYMNEIVLVKNLNFKDARERERSRLELAAWLGM